ncbi:TonB-dependent receptor domain-containing protein [Parahaliea mediterranea]|uniref:TonB-dependent receptor n=1 Tax=Parahaliea mediterranea TaxID=651086 RepID=A0A939DHM3_9GAMM|nr:TonB-dependent receptor [Parahaliea mediterranea]MBN7797637.1 TonB-dependent receptor [Parahaliea mediterranea]
MTDTGNCRIGMGVFARPAVLFPEQTRGVLLSLLAWMLLFLFAGTGSSGVMAQEPERFHLELPAQGLDQSLKGLAETAGVQTLFPFDAISALEAPALHGAYTTAEALEALLVNTGFEGRINDNGVIVVRRTAAADRKQLDEQMITGSNEGKGQSARSRGFLLTALAAFFSSGTVAQEGVSDGPRMLEEVIVTATRRETGIQDTALSINAISGNDLGQNVYTNAAQILDAVPGVTAFNSGPSSNRVIIRNIATSTQEAGGETTATYLDDFAVSGTGTSAPPLRLVDMNRVEVLKGPQGTLFGRSAMGGIIRYITNKPDFNGLAGGIKGYMSATEDGGDNYGGSGYVNLPLGDTLAVRAVGYSYQHDGFIDNVELGRDDINEEDTVGGRLALRWEPTEALTTDLVYLHQSIDSGANWTTTIRSPAADPNGAITPVNPAKRQAIGGVISEINSEYDIINLDIEYRFDNVTAKLIATHTEESWNMVFDQREFVGVTNGCVCDGTEGPTNRDTDTDILELRLVSSGGGRLDWIAGAYYEDVRAETSQKIVYTGSGDSIFGFLPVVDGDIAIDSFEERPSSERALYGELGWAFTDATRLTVGYRRSDVEFATTFTKTDGFFLQMDGTAAIRGIKFATQEDVNTYKVSLEHAVHDDLMAYFTAASGYRRGGFNQPTAISPFSTYDSDSLWSYELGVKSSWLDGRLVANAALFFLDWDDIQLVVQDPTTFARATQNAGAAEIPGFEFSVAAQLTPSLDVTLAGSLTRPELQEDVPGGVSGKAGDTLPGAAEEQFSISANYNRPLRGGFDLYGSLIYRYVGDRLNDFNTDLDVALGDYDLMDLNVGLHSVKGYSIGLFAHNLLDEAVTYAIDRQGAYFEQVPTNPPRTVGVNISYDF